MQDKSVHINKKMTDRGWGEMSKLLDQEMPTAGQKRRRFVWLFLLLGLAVGLASGVFVVKYFTQTKTQPVETNIPIAAEEAGEPGIRDAASLQPQADAENPGQQMPETASGGSGISSKTTRPVAAAVVRQGKVESDAAHLPPAVFEKNQQAGLAIQAKQVDAEKQQVASLQAPASGTLAKVEKLEKLPLEQLPVTEHAAPFVNTDPISGRPAGWAVYHSGLTAPGAGAGGLAAGLVKSSIVKNSNFTLEGGVGYAYLQQPISVIFTSDIGTVSTSSTFNSFSTVLGDARIENKVGATASAAKLLRTLQLHYLEVPLAASYRISPRLSLKGGLNAAVLLSSSSDYTTGGIFNRSFDLASIEEDQTEASFDYNGEQPSAELNQLDLAATAGLDVRMTPRLGVGLGYQFGVVDLIPDNGAGDFNRMVRVTLRYNLTKGK